ncbi:MAG: hypothetical protein GQ527_04725 [Bacteroidales bacterium]|nr:hypothetical protein [Bacteroidales bacterium]
MKKIFTVGLLVFLLFTLPSFSQDKKGEGKFLLKDSKFKLSTFYVEVNPSTSISILNDQLVAAFEISGGLILNNKFYFSFFTTGSPKVNTVIVPELGTPEYNDWNDAGVEMDKISANAEFLYVKFKHSGIKLGYLHHTYKTIFWRTGLQFGFIGGLNMTEDQTFLGLLDNKVYETKIITLEPQFGAGVNLLPWLRFNLDLGYRLMNVDKRILDATQTDSFTIKMGLAFGNFRYKSK